MLLFLAGQLLSFRLLRQVGKRFEAVTAGHEPFDFQNRLTVSEIAAQLPVYTPASRRLYNQFFVVDFFFPLLASTFISLIWSAILSRLNPTIFQDLLRFNAPLVAFLPTVFDWGENVCFLLLVNYYPRFSPAIARLGIICKRLKLASLFTVIPLTGLLLVVTAILLLLSLFTS